MFVSAQVERFPILKAKQQNHLQYVQAVIVKFKDVGNFFTLSYKTDSCLELTQRSCPS